MYTNYTAGWGATQQYEPLSHSISSYIQALLDVLSTYFNKVNKKIFQMKIVNFNGNKLP